MPAFGNYDLGRRRGTVGPLERFEANGPTGPVELERALPAFAKDVEFTAVFLSEARRAQALDHPAVVRVLDVGVVDEVPFVVTEALRGDDLVRARRAAPNSRLGAAEIACLAYDLAAALDAGHVPLSGEPLLHRAVFPENVIVLESGHAKLTRFGIYKALGQQQISKSGLLSSQFRYSAPEYSETGQYTIACDLFSLGVTLYEALAGEHPFEAENAIVMTERVLSGDYRPLAEIVPSAPPLLMEICERLIMPRPNERFRSAMELLSKLEPLRPTDRERAALAAAASASVARPLSMPPVDRSGVNLPGFNPSRSQQGLPAIQVNTSSRPPAPAGFAPGTASRPPNNLSNPVVPPPPRLPSVSQPRVDPVAVAAAPRPIASAQAWTGPDDVSTDPGLTPDIEESKTTIDVHLMSRLREEIEAETRLKPASRDHAPLISAPVVPAVDAWGGSVPLTAPEPTAQVATPIESDYPQTLVWADGLPPEVRAAIEAKKAAAAARALQASPMHQPAGLVTPSGSYVSPYAPQPPAGYGAQAYGHPPAAYQQPYVPPQPIPQPPAITPPIVQPLVQPVVAPVVPPVVTPPREPIEPTRMSYVPSRPKGIPNWLLVTGTMVLLIVLLAVCLAGAMLIAYLTT
jgi:serine/threonine protein kinase